MSNSEKQSNFLPAVRFGKMDELKVHLISDEDLTRLEQGSGQSLFLNFGIGLFSVAVSFLISLLTTTITSDRLFSVFVIVTIIGFLASIILLTLWWFTRRPISELTKKIRERMPPEGEAQQLGVKALLSV